MATEKGYKLATMSKGEVKGKNGDMIPMEFPRWDSAPKDETIDANLVRQYL